MGASHAGRRRLRLLKCGSATTCLLADPGAAGSSRSFIPSPGALRNTISRLGAQASLPACYYQLCQLMPRLLVPNSALVFQFYSHKLMRLAAPIFFLLLLAANVMLVARPSSTGGLIYQAALAAQSLFYCGVLAGAFLLKRNRRVRLLNFAYVFSLMNAAALVGLFYFVVGKRNVWARGECGQHLSRSTIPQQQVQIARRAVDLVHLLA
jgi:hypothetical protein